MRHGSRLVETDYGKLVARLLKDHPEHESPLIAFAKRYEHQELVEAVSELFELEPADAAEAVADWAAQSTDRVPRLQALRDLVRLHESEFDDPEVLAFLRDRHGATTAELLDEILAQHV